MSCCVPDVTPTGCSSSRSTRICPAPEACRPHFDNTIPLDVIDVVVESDGAPFALEDAPSTEVDEAIAGHALAYVHEGSTLQTGIGAIPNIVAAELARGPLGGFGVHSEMFTTGLMRLHQAGKVTNDAKGVFDGVSVTTFALGVAELYEWLDENDDVAFLPVDTVNDPKVISGNANLVSINGALSVDLYGQVMADSIDGRQISGVGGHEDFVAGAELHLDAHSLVCLRSTAERDGEVVSRIAGVPPEGSVVSTPRHHTGVVITEYGAAELTGRDRARAGASAGRHRPPGLPPRPAQGGRRSREGLTSAGDHSVRRRQQHSAGRAGLGVDGVRDQMVVAGIPPVGH